jgi:hypothetical protein
MRVVFDGGKHGQPLPGHPAAVGPQGGSPCIMSAKVFRHDSIIALIMSSS